MLEFKNVTKKFGDIEALGDISFVVDEGEFVFITGPSGAGKTTLLKLLIRELTPTEGSIVFDGKNIEELKNRDIPKLRQSIGSVFQDYKLLPERTVSENVAVALAVKGLPHDEWDARIEQVLKLVGLTERAELFPQQLSGGEQQRAALARALVVNPKVVFADEPTGNLDWETAAAMAELLEKINSEGKTIIVATHDRDVVDKLGKRVVELRGGKLHRDTGAKKEAPKKVKVKSKSKKKNETASKD